MQPSEGGGFEDIAAVALVFLGSEVLVAVGALIAGVLLIARERRDMGFGVIIGWLTGIAAFLLFIQL